MAVGTPTDVLSRLNALLPSSWFRNANAEVDAVLAGIADNQSFVYGLIQYARLQARIQTSTDGFVDLSAYDFFGLNFPRHPGETDAAFSQRIILEIFRERATRHGIVKVLTDLTGQVPILTEPANPGDTGAWDVSFLDVGLWGSTQNNNQVFVTAYRLRGGGIPNIAGFDTGFWDSPGTAWIDLSLVIAPVTDAQIYAAVAQTVAAGVTAWVMIANHP